MVKTTTVTCDICGADARFEAPEQGKWWELKGAIHIGGYPREVRLQIIVTTLPDQELNDLCQRCLGEAVDKVVGSTDLN
jgi:hypothetical protein